MSDFRPAFLSGGPDHEISRGEGGTFTLRPRGGSEGALKAFQLVVADVERERLAGSIEIVKTHESSDHGVGWIDLVIVRVNAA